MSMALHTGKWPDLEKCLPHFINTKYRIHRDGTIHKIDNSIWCPAFTN